MTEHPEPVVLVTAKSVFEADIMVGILTEAGIPAYRPGGMLTDFFAASQQLMNVQGVDVLVPDDRVEEARKLLAEADEQGKILAQQEDDDSDDEGE